MTWVSTASNLFSAVFVAVITAVVTVNLSLRRFYKEKWWESKRDTYMELFSALYHLKRIEQDWYDEVRYPDQHKPDESLGDAKRAAEHRYSLEKTIALSSFLVSDEATRVLEQYVSERNAARRKDPDDTAGLHRDALDKCINLLKVAARKDLRING